MSAARWRRAPVLAACALLLLTGCADESEVTVDPTTGQVSGGGSGEVADAVTLVETRPQDVGDARVVAFNIGADEAMVGVSQGDGPAETATVRVGDAVVIGGRDWQVVRIQPDQEGSGAPGSKAGEVVIAPPG